VYYQCANVVWLDVAQHYGFTDEELDFIINYDINIGWEGVQIQMMKNEINADHSKPLLLTDGLPLILPLQGVKHDSKPCRNIRVCLQTITITVSRRSATSHDS
jgi:hypothetical protein